MYEVFEQLLQSHGVSSYKVSKDTGVTQTSLSNWKAGRSTPTTKTLQRIADYFGVTVDYLMTGKEEPKENPPVGLNHWGISATRGGYVWVMDFDIGMPIL